MLAVSSGGGGAFHSNCGAGTFAPPPRILMGLRRRWGEGGEDVKVGGSEELKEKGYGVDVTEGIDEEEAGAGELVVCPVGDFEDS